MGRQPFGLASPAAWLRRAGHDVRCVDLTRSRLPDDIIRGASLVAFYLPMHTATRLALGVIDRVAALNPEVHLCAYGLYAPLNGDILRAHGVQTVLGPEFENDLLRVANEAGLKARATDAPEPPVVAQGFSPASLPRVAFITPDRSDLPPLTKYASLQVGAGRRVVGYTEATRGCKHRCRHCPIVPVYDGRFRAVPIDVVIADIQRADARARDRRGAGARVPRARV
jgi:tRNA A37 methylthiotransferase MiaB